VKALLAAVIAAVLVGDLVAVAVRATASGGDGGGRPDAAAVRDLQAVLPELIAFVERTRGLRFLRPPDVQLLSDAAFERLLREKDPADPFSGDAPDDETYFGVLRALGLVDGPVDIDAVAAGEFESIVGVYDSRTEILYARGTEPTPFVRLVLVHELVHALDDQHFDLDRRYLDDEEAAAYTAMVEGDAVWVESRWYFSRSAQEQADIDAEVGSGDGTERSIFYRLLGFPYIVGPDFVEAVRGAGGQRRLDEAFTAPPVTTEQVLHPERFLARERARTVADPAANGRIVDSGVLGEAFLRLVLETAVDEAVAVRAAEGWGGDSYVAWRSGSRTCVRFNVVMDTSQDTAELLSALRAWTAAHPGATVRGASPVTVTNCA